MLGGADSTLGLAGIVGGPPIPGGGGTMLGGGPDGGPPGGRNIRGGGIPETKHIHECQCYIMKTPGQCFTMTTFLTHINHLLMEMTCGYKCA